MTNFAPKKHNQQNFQHTPNQTSHNQTANLDMYLRPHHPQERCQNTRLRVKQPRTPHTLPKMRQNSIANQKAKNPQNTTPVTKQVNITNLTLNQKRELFINQIAQAGFSGFIKKKAHDASIHWSAMKRIFIKNAHERRVVRGRNMKTISNKKFS
jgi:hypothetical protein